MSKDIKKYLGVDWGEARIGLAVADSETKMAIPFGVVKSIFELLEVTQIEEIDEIVIGEPLKMISALVDKRSNYLEFLDKLKKSVDIPVKTIDERLTSLAADALEGNKKTKASRDAVAAMLILQTYLDRELV